MFKSHHGRGGPGVENLAVSTVGDTCVLATRQKLVAYNLNDPETQVSKFDCAARWVTGMVQVGPVWAFRPRAALRWALVWLCAVAPRSWQRLAALGSAWQRVARVYVCMCVRVSVCARV